MSTTPEPVLGQATFITDPGNLAGFDGKQEGGDGTATGGALVLDRNTTSQKGTSGNDVVTLDSLKFDKDQVINTGAGDDLFRWNGQVGAREGGINGIVKFGADLNGGQDVVVLANQLEDYKFTLRSDGGVKVQYVGSDNGIDGAAVTFYGADLFTFRNIEDGRGEGEVAGFDRQTFSVNTAELIALIAENQVA